MSDAMEKRPRNFHVPLDARLYDRLIEEAHRCSLPATQVARKAIEHWIEVQRQQEVERALRVYAEALAGTPHDFDPGLEAAALEHLREPPFAKKRRRQ